jgi:uncharacterized protein (TIGR02757 family)
MTIPHHIKDYLDDLVLKYNKLQYIDTDPVGLVHSFRGNRNREFAAFIASLFSFGSVKQIRRNLKSLFDRIPVDIYQFLRDFDDPSHERFADLKHRFIKGHDIFCIMSTLSAVIGEYGSIESLFFKHHANSGCMKETISHFSEELRSLFRHSNSQYRERTLRFTFPSPASGCAAKRMNLFLRWMVRDDQIDLGLWSTPSKSDLILPLDTHTARISKQIGFTKRKNPGWAMALEITEYLRRLDPEDPVKYDFALTRMGMFSQIPQVFCKTTLDR